MKHYMSVKEVCELTGLTRKHLYYFHHQNIVRATAYANYSVEGNDGYKLYDKQAVEKLQQIALFYKLGFNRNEIRNIMLDPDYDCHAAMDTLIAQKEKKRIQIDNQITMLKLLKLTNMKDELSPKIVKAALRRLEDTEE